MQVSSGKNSHTLCRYRNDCVWSALRKCRRCNSNLPLLRKSATAACVNVLVETVCIRFRRNTFSLNLPGIVQPILNPGASDFENEAQCKTRPFLSKLLHVLGLVFPKYNSP